MNPAAILTQLGDKATSGKALPPVDQWHPAHCGEMDLVICADGRWMHEGTPIGRARLVHMLSRVLRREPDGSYCLVTPAEKVTIQVEDRPFLAVDCSRIESDSVQTEPGQTEPRPDVWQLVTDQGDVVRLEGETCLTLSETPDGLWLPEVPVRFGLAARLHRNLYYRLLESAETHEQEDGSLTLGFMSGGRFQILGQLAADEVEV
ncbi:MULTISPECIES: DUF1285 domain-containing protein [unclassified Cobetia]|uniref:DUF1285 domain-containing protein n=1 Tax=unclassified Cobetia TaxID=2609414 RepID=UPI00209821D4|nr:MULTISPECIES: DUF1285 domain-containing protein [unclassified Cobetia]MCO7232259.1 DUF1285 domain-containing protein [Cobetia sp. Dlab-2-AX]MCO7235364.1 DUF1285 domain-containing protein [Cobetia sp. Dlab-2-U]